MTTETNRLNSIDLFKAMSIFAVILIHTHPFSNPSAEVRTIGEMLVNQASRFAVPFFFMISGYYLALKVKVNNASWGLIWTRSKRLFLLFSLWSLIYLLLSLDISKISEFGYFKVIFWKLYTIWEHPITTLFQGTAAHLWFLPSLIIGQCFVFLLYQFGIKWILPITFVLFILGVIGGAYSATSIGITLPFDTRDGPFMSSICFGIGFVMGIKGLPRINMKFATALLMLGAMGQLIEAAFLWNTAIIDPTQIDYVFSTLPFTIGFMLLAFSIEIKHASFLTQLGKSTLGIYLIHELFVELLKPLSFVLPSIVYALIVPAVILLLAYGATLLFQRTRSTQALLA
jgi:surface polysaccharide O-acyltransferase-like enzyme